MAIITNAAECLLCGDVIESTHRHDFKWCSCGNLAVDGGRDYTKRCFGGDWVDRSTFNDDGEATPPWDD